MDENRSHQAKRFVCPTCKRPIKVAEDAAGLPQFFPFCSERCRLIDLGAWLDAEYRIPARPDEESEESRPGNVRDDPGDSPS